MSNLAWCRRIALFLSAAIGIAACSAAEPDANVVTSDPATITIEPQGGNCGAVPCPPVVEHEVRLPSTISNSTTRATSELRPIVIDNLRSALLADGTIDVDEGRDLTTTANAFRLAAAVTSISYANGNLNVKVQLTIFKYSNGSLLGNILKSVTMLSVTIVDHAKEDQLVGIASRLAAEAFADTINAFY